MKKLHIIIVLVLSFSFSSFAMLTKNSASEKKQMQVDAYAKANVECEYSLAKLQYSQDSDNKVLKLKVNELNKNVTAFRQKMFNRYSDIGNLKVEFTKMVEASTSNLTTCKKLETLEQSIADEKAARQENEKSKSSEKK